MNDIDCKLKSTLEAAIKYAHKSGHAERSESRKEWSLVHAASFLSRSGKTIDWSGNADCPFGYETIWEFAAGEYWGFNKKPVQKVELAKEHSVDMRNGFSRLKERLFDEWGYVLLTVPRSVDRQQIVVITLDLSYVVNDRGQTAYDIQLMRDEKLVRGQIKSSFQRSARLVGVSEATQSLEGILNHIALQPLSSPKGNQLAKPDMFEMDLLTAS